MREIKFRVWSISHAGNKGTMHYLNPVACTFSSTDLIEEERWKVMQFTGLKDKNGKEIYEGDILNGDFPDVVFWDDDRGQWMLRNSENPDDTLWEIIRDNKPRIIGNIYENPELLEAK